MAPNLKLPPRHDLPTPRWSDLDAAKHWDWDYDKKLDAFFLHPGTPQKGLSIQGDGVWLLIHPVTGEILGLHIEDFTRIFLAKHPELANAWRQIKAKRTPEAQKESWLEVLLRCVRSLMGGGTGHPQQPRLLAPQ